MLERLYLRLHDRLVRRPRLVLGLVGLAVAASLPALGQMRLDMSFRPLFADDPSEAAATREFEAVFGQASGAFVGVVIERDGILGAPFLRELSLLSGEVARLPRVSEVVSLARLAVPVWGGGGARGAWVVPPEVLEAGAPEHVERHLQALRENDALRGALLSADGRRTLLLARLDLPLEDLGGRRGVIRELRALVNARLGEEATLRFVGVSVVEDEYAGIVLRGLARSFVLTSLALVGVLWLIFRRAAAVAALMAGVCLAVPVSLALLTLIGQELTMINSMVPVMILIIGVADGLHMLRAFLLHLRRGMDQPRAVRAMYGEMAMPCLLVALTTALGFLSLRTAHITAIRDFGLNVAIGIVVVYLLNLVLLPVLLRRIPAERLLAESGTDWGERWSRGAARLVVARPGAVALACLLLTVTAGAAVPGLRVDQRFNEEVAAGHPVRADQALLEREFGGMLGPEVDLRRADGSSLLDAESLRRLRAYAEGARRLPGVLRVESVLDFLPQGTAGAEAARGLAQLRADPLLGRRVREVVDAGGARAAVLVRTTDVGSRRARDLGLELQRLAREHLGPAFEAQVVGQWWLAQRGMDNILRDMLASFATSCVLILPLMALALRRTRLILLSVVPNLLPMLLALAFMAWAGISLRIGTAMVLAIALGIAVDDTVHVLVRLREEIRVQPDPEAAVRATLRRAGGGVVYTTLALVIGFLSMLSNDLLAIRDMGLVAAVTLSTAMVADLYLTPALYLLTSRRPHPAGPHPARSDAPPSPAVPARGWGLVRTG